MAYQLCTFFNYCFSFLTRCLFFVISKNVDIIGLINLHFIFFLPVLGLVFKVYTHKKILKLYLKFQNFYSLYYWDNFHNFNLLKQLSYSYFFCIVLHNLINFMGFLMVVCWDFRLKKKKQFQ